MEVKDGDLYHPVFKKIQNYYLIQEDIISDMMKMLEAQIQIWNLERQLDVQDNGNEIKAEIRYEQSIQEYENRLEVCRKHRLVDQSGWRTLQEIKSCILENKKVLMPSIMKSSDPLRAEEFLLIFQSVHGYPLLALYLSFLNRLRHWYEDLSIEWAEYSQRFDNLEEELQWPGSMIQLQWEHPKTKSLCRAHFLAIAEEKKQWHLYLLDRVVGGNFELAGGSSVNLDEFQTSWFVWDGALKVNETTTVVPSCFLTWAYPVFANSFLGTDMFDEEVTNLRSFLAQADGFLESTRRAWSLQVRCEILKLDMFHRLRNFFE